MLGHELRNPLAAILTALDVMRARDGKLQRETAIIEHQTNYLVRLVADLLDVSRITSGAISLQRTPTNLECAIAHAVELAGPQLTSRGHALAIDVAEELVVDADSERLAQVLAIVLSNAASYTPHGGRVELTALRDGADVRVTIRDNGTGIAADQLPTIFEPFARGRKSPELASGGLGIGLAIARSIVRLHAGEIELRSDGVGAGTEVSIRWPRATAS